MRRKIVVVMVIMLFPLSWGSCPGDGVSFAQTMYVTTGSSQLV